MQPDRQAVLARGQPGAADSGQGNQRDAHQAPAVRHMGKHQPTSEHPKSDMEIQVGHQDRGRRALVGQRQEKMAAAARHAHQYHQQPLHRRVNHGPGHRQDQR